MSNIGPINANISTQTSTANVAQIATSLQQGQSLNVQVLKLVSPNIAQLQSQLGQFKLSLAEAHLLTPGSKWVLQSSNGSQNLTLTPQTSGQTQGSAQAAVPQQGVSTQTAQTSQGQALSAKLVQTSDISSLQGQQATPSKTSPQATLQNHLAAHRQDAATKQNSFTGLFTTLSTIVTDQSQALNAAPDGKAIKTFAEQILGLRLTQNSTGADVKHAIKASGLFHEGQGLKFKTNTTFLKQDGFNPFTAFTNSAPSTPDYSSLNLKNFLFQLQSLSVKLNGAEPGVPTHLLENAPLPPEADGPLQGQKPQNVAFQEDTQHTHLQRLTEQVTQALSRLKLLQLSSLPSQGNLDFNQGETARLSLNFELPIALSTEQTAVLALRITREQEHNTSYEQNKYVWSVNLALDTDETGQIDAHVTLNRSQVHIHLWADDRAFSEILNEHVEVFQARLADEGLEVGQIKILHGRRPDFKTYARYQEGRYLDHNL